MSTAAIKTASATLANLQTAYNGERNAHARYIEFARKADAEGYAGVASLFRAAARAEKIHAENHAVVIRKMNAQPTARIEAAHVRSTRENLMAAIEGETYERDVMYPGFVKIAKAEKNSSAVWTFDLAMAAEAEHAKLYTNASENQDSLKAAKDFYVCTVCGYTVAKIDFDKCPACKNPKEKYEKVV